ncbi:MAG: rod shape-determining protein MreC [Bacteroidota bacterium]
MKNLRIFILKNYFFFLFLVFELVSVSLLVSTNNFHNSTFINSSSGIIGSLMDKKAQLMEYLHLDEINDELLQENANLKMLLKDSKYVIKKGKIVFTDSNSVVQYIYLPAHVINNTLSQQNNFLTLNRGSLDGVKKDWGVTTGNSIVGFVKDVSPHYCTVVSVLNRNFVLSVKLKKTNDHGLIRWDGEAISEVVLTGITVDAPVEEGDTIVTRGSSARFPENILVGLVTKVEQKPGSMHHHITVELATKFNSLYNVYIINNTFREEQKALEAKLEEPK